MNEREMSEHAAATRKHVQDAKLAEMAKHAASLAEDRKREAARRK